MTVIKSSVFPASTPPEKMDKAAGGKMIYNLGNRAVNNYLVSYDEGYILIDTGYEGGVARFQKKLKKANVAPNEIKYIFLTHAHDDHAGFLNEVLAVTDAKVILHPKAVEGLKRGQNSMENNSECSAKNNISVTRKTIPNN